MSEPPSPMPDDAFADVPLLREIQRVLLSSSGPINWELARQVGIASAGMGQGEPAETEEDRRGLEGAVRMAELAVAEATGLLPPADVGDVKILRRSEWVEASTNGLRGLFEPGAERLNAALGEAQREQLPESAAGGAQMFDALLGRMAPLLTGAQVGMVLGALAQRVLAQYDVPLPRVGRPGVLFVLPNIVSFERDWSLPRDQVRAWVALHETTHAFQLGRPWVHDHVVGLLREVAGAMEFDVAGLQERLEGLDLSDPQRMQDALGGELLTGSLSDEQRLLIRRVQAFLAATEGHAEHVVASLGRRLLPELPRIEEALRRRDEEAAAEERAAERLLGIDAGPDQRRLGREFCETVVELTDERTLARMWDGPEALPSMPELEEPRLWLARTA